MCASELPANRMTQSDTSLHTLLLAAFSAAIFISAALLFAVEPMFTKMVLPRLGGAAAVWSVAMVFFQATLLAGYAYAHLLTRFAPGRGSVLIHLAVLLIACLALPLHLAGGWGQPPSRGEAFWLLGLFAASIGLPFFALAANGPLMQAWFVRTDHPSARDPYFLFAASNVGSFLALISYPTVIEPFLRLSEQTWLWTVGFYALILLIAACGVLLLGSANMSPVAVTARREETAPPTWRDRLAFVGLAAVPSGLLLAVTLHISTNAAAVPLFWVLPLAMYLLTFVVSFQSRPVVPHSLVVQAFPFVILALASLMIIDPFSTIVELVVVHLTRVLRDCALMPRRACAAAAGAEIPHRLLHVDFGRRHDRRHRGRADCPAGVQLGGRISPADRALGPVHAGARAAGEGRRAISPVRCTCRGGGAADNTHVVGPEAR